MRLGSREFWTSDLPSGSMKPIGLAFEERLTWWGGNAPAVPAKIPKAPGPSRVHRNDVPLLQSLAEHSMAKAKGPLKGDSYAGPVSPFALISAWVLLAIMPMIAS